MTAFRVRPWNSGYRRVKPARDPRYRAFIGRQASVVSGFGPCDPCHTGPHGYGQKASDYDCIPLTRKEHRKFDADPHAFAELHQLDIPNLIEQFNALYFAGRPPQSEEAGSCREKSA